MKREFCVFAIPKDKKDNALNEKVIVEDNLDLTEKEILVVCKDKFKGEFYNYRVLFIDGSLPNFVGAINKGVFKK